MDHDKIKVLLLRLDARVKSRGDILVESAADLIRDLRTECDNQAMRIADLDQALGDIVNPLGAIKRYAAEQGRQIEGIMALQLCNDPEHLRNIARAARAKPKD